MRILEALYTIVEHALEFLSWREDWNRTWSPVSYWLAVFSFLTLVLVAAVYGHSAWQYIRAWLAPAT